MLTRAMCVGLARSVAVSRLAMLAGGVLERTASTMAHRQSEHPRYRPLLLTNARYTETRGLPMLRAEIARSSYPGLSADDILCFSGAEEGIYTAVRALLTRDDHCIIVTPCYLSLRSVAAAVCGSVTCVELLPEEGWRLDMVALEAAFTPATRMVIINYPHNPTGALLTAAEQAAVVALCRRHGACVLRRRGCCRWCCC